MADSTPPLVSPDSPDDLTHVSIPGADVPLSQRDTIDIDPPKDDGPKQPWWLYVVDRNPMFLISGVLILAGCFLVSQYIHSLDPDEVGIGLVLRLLITLLVVLNIYEFAVIGLGLALAKTKTLVRDTRHLLGLALLLVVDAAFVYTETGVADPAVGVWIAAIASLLACVKGYLVLRSLRITPTVPAMVVTGLTLAGMYFMPVIARGIAHDGFLPEHLGYAVWVGVGVLIGLHAVPGQWMRFGAAVSEDHRQLQQFIGVALVVLPVVSLIGHAYAALWVYELPFNTSVLSPLLLGLSAVVLRHADRLGGTKPSAQAASLVMASAIVLSLSPTDALLFQSDVNSWVSASPLRGVLLIASALLFWAWWIAGRTPLGLINCVLPLVAASLGHTLESMALHIEWLGTTARMLLIDYLPKTRLHWGATAIAGAFLTLLIGGALSWWRRSHEQKTASGSGLPAGPAR